MTESFSRKPFRDAERDFRDLVSVLVRAWKAFSRPRRTTAAYRALLEAPMDLAACGYDVSVRQDERGWHIDVRKELTQGSVLHLTGDARSYASALFQLADSAELAITDLERRARNRHADRGKAA